MKVSLFHLSVIVWCRYDTPKINFATLTSRLSYVWVIEDVYQNELLKVV